MHKTIGMELKVLLKILNTNNYNTKNKTNVKKNLHIYFFIYCTQRAYMVDSFFIEEFSQDCIVPCIHQLVY